MVLADAQLVIARELGLESWPKLKAALAPCTISEEVMRIQAKLREDGKEEFIPLLTKERIKAGIRAGIESHEAHHPLGENPDEGKLYFSKVVKSYGLAAVLELVTPKERFRFSQSVLDVWYGQY
jgi:hypothetical protein